jgi:hypothetical protein
LGPNAKNGPIKNLIASSNQDRFKAALGILKNDPPKKQQVKRGLLVWGPDNHAGAFDLARAFQGRVVVQLGRFIVLQRADKSIAAIDMSNVLKISRPEDARRFWRNPAAHMKPNREKIEAEELVKERLPLTKWELTPKEKEDFDRVMRLMFDAASILYFPR